MSVADNLADLKENLPTHVKLIAVSKTVQREKLIEAVKAGQKIFAENYVQEAKAKWPELRAECDKPRSSIELHLIGHLQSNKAADAVQIFDAIDTLDRPKLAHALARAMAEQKKNLPLLIEVNIGNEPQKQGCAIADVNMLLQLARDELKLDVQGLMCVPPEGQDPTPYFQKLASLAHELKLPRISMGMSGDWQAAVTAGATEVRIGSGIFGKRIIARAI